MARWANGDFAGQRPGDASKVIAAEWKKLGQSDKAKYEALEKADLNRYEREVQSVLGRPIKRKSPSASE